MDNLLKNNNGQVWCGCSARCSIHHHIQLKPWLMTQTMSQQIASTKLRFHSIISVQIWKWLLHVESSLSLFLSHLKNTTNTWTLHKKKPTLLSSKVGNKKFINYLKSLVEEPRVFWVNIAKSELNLRYRYCLNLIGKLRKEKEFRQ